MPCPNGVDIPRNFEIYNDGHIHEDIKTSRNYYARFVPDNEKASACVQCRECEKKCPQKIEISEMMKWVHRVLGEGREEGEGK
jgi:predicted aldo/keto reductase-like oxidoreductase